MPPSTPIAPQLIKYGTIMQEDLQPIERLVQDMIANGDRGMRRGDRNLFQASRGSVKAYRARYSPEAGRRIRRLHPEIKQEIKEGVRTLLNSPLAGHELHFELAGYWSLRVRTHLSTII